MNKQCQEIKRKTIEAVRLNVTTLGGSGISVRASKLDTIAQLKMLLTKKIDVPLCRMKLFYFGTRLEDHFKIHDYDICDGDNMRLMMSFFAMGKDGCLE